MKHFYLLLLFLLPFCLNARMYEVTLIYDDGKEEVVEASFPLNKRNKTLVISKEGERERIVIDKEKITYLKLKLNNGEDVYYFKRGYYIYNINKKGKIKTLKKRIWSLVDKTQDQIVVSYNGDYAIKKYRKKKDKVIVSSTNFGTSYLLSKTDDDLFFDFFLPGQQFDAVIKKSQPYIFPNCPDIEEKVKKVENRKGRYSAIFDILDIYSSCEN